MRLISDHLVFKHGSRDIGRIIPQAKTNSEYTAVPFSLKNSILLRNIGIKSPSPIQTEYDWPGKYKPYKHQVLTAEFATLNKRAFILNGLGSGKSISALWAADYLMRQGVINRVLIISPLSTLDVVWAREIFQNFPGRSYAVLHGTSDKRKKLLAQKHNYYIINHHGVKVLERELRERTDIDLYIIDEAASSGLRNSQSVNWRTLRKLLTPDKWAWGMTGSPTPQAPTDAYAIAKLIKPENVPYSFTTFKNTTMMQISPFKWIPRKNAETMVSKVLSPSIRFALRDCIDLPETIVQYRSVEMTPDQTRHYKELKARCVSEVRGVQVTAVNAAVLLGKLVQAAVGCLYGPNGELLKLDCSHRIKETLEIIDECDEKVIVFVPLTGALHMVKKEIERHYKCVLVEGDTSKHQRQQAFDALQTDPEVKVLLAQPGAMSHGVSLTAASTTIWFAPVTSNEIYQQACARTVRPGQKNVTNIVNLSATKEETKIYEALQQKTKFQDIVLELAKKD